MQWKIFYSNLIDQIKTVKNHLVAAKVRTPVKILTRRPQNKLFNNNLFKQSLLKTPNAKGLHTEI